MLREREAHPSAYDEINKQTKKNEDSNQKWDFSTLKSQVREDSPALSFFANKKNTNWRKRRYFNNKQIRMLKQCNLPTRGSRNSSEISSKLQVFFLKKKIIMVIDTVRFSWK
jgi:hypothetical protein